MRRSCTVREVLVALVVLTLLGVLGLSAVVKLRESAKRMTCTNNLKQHGLAVHGYLDTHEHFPSGTMPNPELSVEQRFSFHVTVVPFVECGNLYSSLVRTAAWDAPANVAVMEHYTARLYQCPHGLSGAKDPALPRSGHLAFTNYVGVAGVGADAATRPADAPGNGIFGYDRAIAMKDIKDGASSTALLLETAHDVGPWIRGGPGTVRAVGVDDAQFGGTHTRRPWLIQKRVDGFNVLLADGSVRFTKPDIDPAILAALATVAGGEEVPANW